MFSDMSIVGISGFFHLHSNRGDKMPYFSKAVDEDENISIYNTYKGARQQQTYVVYRNITPSALRNREGTELSLGSLTRGFYPRANIIVADETLDIPIDIRLLVGAANKFVTLGSSRVATSDAIIGQLDNSEAEAVRVRDILLSSEVQGLVTFLVFRKGNSAIIASSASEGIKDLGSEAISFFGFLL